MGKKVTELVASRKEERKAGKMDEWMERRKERWMDGRKERRERKEGRKIFLKNENLILFESLSVALQSPRSLTSSDPAMLSLTHAHSQTDSLLVSSKASGKDSLHELTKYTFKFEAVGYSDGGTGLKWRVMKIPAWVLRIPDPHPCTEMSQETGDASGITGHTV